MTHTYATLMVSKALYDEVASKLKAAGYSHAFSDEIDGAIDLHGIALVRDPSDADELIPLSTILENLNRMLEADPEAIKYLLQHSAFVNSALADDPTCQVGVPEGADAKTHDPRVRPLGWLNGALGVRPNGYGYVAAICRDDGSIEKFVETTGKEK